MKENQRGEAALLLGGGTKALRVCVVSPLYHPSLGGVGRQAMLLTERLCDLGLSAFVIARRMEGMPPAHYSSKVEVYRAWSLKPRLHTFEDVTLTNVMVSLSFCLGCAFQLFRNRKKYDVVHFHGASLPLFINLPILKMMGKKVIAKVAGMMGTEAGSLRDRHLGLGNLLTRLLRIVDRFVATSSQIEAGLLNDRIDPAKIVRIPNFIPVDNFQQVSGDLRRIRKAALGYGAHPVVTFSGRFIACKGIHHLLDAWKIVAETFPKARVQLLGDGLLLPEMKKVAADLGIDGAVDFRGHVDDVRDYLYATDIFVLSSLQEGMPNSLLEAMACGLPAVATRVGGVTDIIRDGVNGIMVNPGDPQDLAKGLCRLLQDEKFARTLGNDACKTIRDDYSLDAMIPRYMKLYSEI